MNHVASPATPTARGSHLPDAPAGSHAAESGRDGGKVHWLASVAIVLLACGCLAQVVFGYSDPTLAGHAWGTDDAYISYRYAENLAAGRGLVFNPGERVEGYSNLLYVLLLAPATAAVSRESLYAVSAALNALLALAAAYVLYAFARPRLGERGAAALLLLFATVPSVWVAVASGLETPLVLLLQVVTWVLVEKVVERDGTPRAERFLGMVAALSVLARSDGFITPIVATAFLALHRRWRPAAVTGLATLATAAALTVFRLAYYGWPLPNTYYAKVTGSSLRLRLESGSQRLLTILLATGLLFYVAIIAATALRAARAAWRRPRAPLTWVSFPLSFAAAWLAGFVWVGGDVFYDRFLVCLFPMGGYLLLALLRERARSSLGALLLALTLVMQLARLGVDPRFRFTLAKYDYLIELGRFLGARHPGALLACDAVGKVPYFSGLRTIDMYGLTDVTIGHGRMVERGYFRPGHGKGDLPYVISRQPNLIAAALRDDFSPRAGPVVEPDLLAAAGYRLVYLLNTRPRSQSRDLLDVSRSTGDEIRSLLAAGYDYGVFAGAELARRVGEKPQWGGAAGRLDPFAAGRAGAVVAGRAGAAAAGLVAGAAAAAPATRFAAAVAARSTSEALTDTRVPRRSEKRRVPPTTFGTSRARRTEPSRSSTLCGAGGGGGPGGLACATSPSATAWPPPAGPLTQPGGGAPGPYQVLTPIIGTAVPFAPAAGAGAGAGAAVAGAALVPAAACAPVAHQACAGSSAAAISTARDRRRLFIGTSLPLIPRLSRL